MAKESVTGLSRADLLSVSSIVLLKTDVDEQVAKTPPRGWHIADDSDVGVVWVRDHPLPSAGGVVWHTPGLDLQEQGRDDNSVRIRVGAVPADGGKIVLSRLAWPGYQVQNATVTDPVDDYLLTLHVSARHANSEVTVKYAPPHWGLLLRVLAAAIAAGLIWSLGVVIASRARRRSTSRSPTTTGRG